MATIDVSWAMFRVPARKETPQGTTPPVTPGCAKVGPRCGCRCAACADCVNKFGDCDVAKFPKPVRYRHGEIELDAVDVASAGFGTAWEHSRSYSNQLTGAGGSPQGVNWLVYRWAYLVPADDGTVAVVRGTEGTIRFAAGGGGYAPLYGAHATLTHAAAAGTFTLALPSGDRIVFHDFGQTAFPPGTLARHVAPGGVTTEAVSYNAAGYVEEIRRTAPGAGGTPLTEAFVYAFAGGRIDTVTLRRRLGTGGWADVRRAAYDYYGAGGSFGSPGDLRRARVQVPVAAGWADADTSVYRYYVAGEEAGFAHGLKYVLNPAACARMAGDGLDPLTATNAQVAGYAQNYFEYDGDRRVTKEAVDGGAAAYAFEYTAGYATGEPNVWATRAQVTRPDGSRVVAYTNAAGQYLLRQEDNGSGAAWLEAFQYDDELRLVRHATPAAVVGYDDAAPDLAVELRAAAGLIETATYYAAAGGGGAPGYTHTRSVQQGTGGDPAPQVAYEFAARTAAGMTVHEVSKQTAYRNADGTGAIETLFAYEYHDGTTQMSRKTTTWPAVTTEQNGSGLAASRAEVFDVQGRLRWAMDELGFIAYLAYDQATGAVVKRIADVDTEASGEFADLPAGWETPAGGGLNLVTLYEVDDQGRAVRTTSPNGRVDFMVYDDEAHEARAYPGWDATAEAPTGPTRVSREDRGQKYAETLTMSAAPDVSAGWPTGAEAIADVQSLERSLFDDAGKLVHRDRYTDLTGLSYATTPTIGTAGVNYDRTSYDYDAEDRLVRTVNQLGTISRTVFDFLGRPVSAWIGTNDTPATGVWSPANNASPANMVMVAAYEYDGGGVGNGNRTKTTQYPGGGAADRVTQAWFDWRDRAVATKGGVQTTEATDVHRPIAYVNFDNLNRVVMSRRYDGDGVDIVVTDGLPQPPSSSILRAQSETLFDERGQVYRDQTYSVDPGTGEVSTDALKTDAWFNARGQVIAAAAPGGLWQKTAYDGAGRVAVTYVTDGDGGTSWAAANTVEDDHVLEQSEPTYDESGNVLAGLRRLRFHDATGTGPLGTPSSGVGARVYYQAAYYDLSDRATSSVDVGTNGGAAYTRPPTAPGRSDTELVTDTSYDAAGNVFAVTDPRGLVTRTLYDLAGRVLTKIENYTDGTPTADSNKTATFAYNAVGMTSLMAVLTGGGYQTTAWVYGVTTDGGNGLNSNDIVSATQYPDPTTGDPSEDEEETVTVNALGQTLTTTDRNGTVHAFAYDVLGRPTADVVSSLGDGVDDAVLRVETSYDTQGNVYQVTTFDADTAGNVVNQIQRGYNGLSQLTVEYQATNGSVDTGTTPKVQYAYSEMAGGANHNRLTLMTYPSGRELQQQYAEGLDDSISRLTAIIDEETTLEGYQYLGLRDIVVRSHPEPDVDLSYVKLASEGDGDAGDQYTGLDRFGRVVDQRWRTPAGIDVQRFGYGHDRDGNRVYRENLVSSDHSEIYSYDGLNQLLGFERGVLNGTKTGITGTVTRSQEWEFDAVGNFADQMTDGVGQARTHNRLNEITGIDGATTPTYDANGNMTGDEVGRTFAYDAWNRLTKAWDTEETLLAVYGYDGTGRRVREVTVSDATDLYYSIAWQICEERVDDNPVISYAWSQLYIDSMIARNRDTEAIGELDERIYMAQDAAFNAVALLNAAGVAKEFYQYDPFGSASIFGELWTHISTSNFYWKYFFQGLRFESDASSYNVRFRDMNPELARCFTKDPVGIVPDVNYYRWENNNPCNSLDPYGQQSYPPGWNPYAPYPGNGAGPAPKVPLKGPPPFPKAAGAKSGPFSNKETLLGANACWCPTDKKDRLTDITSVVINKGVPVGPSGGDHQFYGPLAPKDGRIGAGGAGPCIGVVIVCAGGVAVFHFSAGNSPHTTLDNYIWPKGCRAIVCGGDDTRGSNCLADAVIEELKDQGIKIDGVDASSACGVNSDGSWYTSLK